MVFKTFKSYNTLQNKQFLHKQPGSQFTYYVENTEHVSPGSDRIVVHNYTFNK